MNNKYCLITGASSGLGFEFAKLYAKDGYNLVLVARREEKLKENKEELLKINKEINIVLYSFDLTDENNIDLLYKNIKEAGYRIEILINNAGFAYHSSFLEGDYNKQKELVSLNILTLMKMTYLFGNMMKENMSGSILNIASLAAYFPGPYCASYYASKSYVLSFSEAIYEEFKEYNVYVSAICPGPTKTEFEKTAGLEDSNMFKSLKVMKAKDVALLGYKAIKKKKTNINCGFLTKFGNIASRLVTKKIARLYTKKINKKPTK